MPYQPEPVAIVGMACLFPKAANLADYWANIVSGRDCLTDVPKDHSWSPDDYYTDDPKVPDRTWATRGGFLEKVPFDPIEHGVIPVALEAIDSDQLLALIVARECLKDAGIDPDQDAGWNRDRTAVVLGHTSTSELVVDLSARLHGPKWKRALRNHGIDEATAEAVCEDIVRFFPDWQEQSFPGMLANVVAGRIANRLDLGGTNATVDAACASSLAALELAVADLQAGRSDIALTGGSDTLNDIFMYMCFTKTPALSKTGDARPFDIGSEGIIIAEGIGMVAMKRLSDAERDGDRIYAVIKGIGASSDGRHKSIYAPNSNGQTKAIRRAYDEAGFGIDTVELIEAHGTGTKAGDLAEVTGLQLAWHDTEHEGQRVALGSVKSQIGHTKATAGAAGLIKLALALYHRVLPPTAKIDRPNPKMQFEESPFYLNTEARPWIRAGDHPRRGGVSAFGFGGSNFHVALEEYGAQEESRPVAPAERALFLFGADDLGGLTEALEVSTDQPSVHHAEHAVLVNWSGGEWVISFTAGSLSELEQHLETARRLVRTGEASTENDVTLARPANHKLAVLFPGQGSQYTGMGQSLALRHAPFRCALDRAEESFRVAGRGSLGSRIYPIPAYDDETRTAQAAELTRTEWAQPAIGAVSKGMYDTLLSYGVQPDALAGHSYGELVALCAAGVFDEDALWTASRIRGEAMADKGVDRGTMAAASAPLAEIEAVLSTLGDGVVLANRNHPRQGVISGSREGIARAIAALEDAGISSREIPVSAAFHSELVADAATPLADALAQLPFSAPTVPVYANVTGARYPEEADACRALLGEQLTSAVDFVGIVESLVADGVRTFVECGPKGVLAGLLRRCLKGVDDAVIVSLDGKRQKVDGDSQLKATLATLAARGVSIDTAPILAERLPPAPRTAGSKATVWIGGANYKRESTLNPELPVRPALAEAATVAPAPAARPAAPAVRPAASAAAVRPASPAAATRPAPPRVAAAQPASRSAIAPPAFAPTSDALSSALAATRQALASFQNTQALAADVHAQFLQGHAAASERFAAMFEQHTRLVGAAQGTGVPLVPASRPVAARPVAARPVASRPVAAPPIAARSVVTRPAAPVSATRPVASRPSAPAAPAVDLEAALIAAVAEKTGYPADLVQLDMDLETDLGVDSIKRVEILSAVKERVPSLPDGDDEALGSLRTLADIAGFLGAALGGAAPVAPAAPSIDVAGALIASVAEKTGYPVDLVELDMDMEGDLGIDSIKRVEILSAVSERLPSLGDVDEDAAASARTLREILALFQTPAAESSAPAESAVDVRQVVFDTIAGKTGYPVDLIEPGMDLESDLGIDSIKRVEILSAVQEAVPGLPDLDGDQVASQRTVEQIVGLLGELVGAPAAPAAVAAPTIVEPLAVPTGPVRKEVVLAAAPMGDEVPLPGRVLLTADAGGFAEQLATELRLRGCQPVVVELDYTSEETVRGGIEGTFDAVVHCAALGADPSSLRARVRGGFLLAKVVGPVGRFATISGLGGRFGRTSSATAVEEGAVGGLAKTLTHEWPEVQALALDIEPGAVSAARVVDELARDRGAVEIGLDAEHAWTLMPSTCDVIVDDFGGLPLDAGDLVVVTGGAKGVTARVLEEVAKRYQPAFLLLGRSVLTEDPSWAVDVPEDGLQAACIQHLRSTGDKVTPKAIEGALRPIRSSREIRKNLDIFESIGCSSAYAAVDARSSEQVAAAVAGAVEAHGPVRGIVHGAGVIADKWLADKTEDQFDRVYDTKVAGLDALLGAVDIPELKVAAMFSSVAGRYGNRGQVDYAMGNEVLARAGDRLKLLGVPRVKVFAWGPWAGGMVSPALARQIAAQGVSLIELDEGARAFCDELEATSDVVEVVVGEALGVDRIAPETSGSVTWQLDTRTDRFLTDHQIGGKPVLPFVMALERMIAAARDVFPGLRVLGARDVAVLKGVVLDESTKELTVTWTVAPARDGATAALDLRLVGDKGPLGLPLVHYKSTVDLTSAPLAEATQHPGSNGLGKQAYPHSVEQAYGEFLFHGPGFQGIRKVVGMSDHGIVGALATSKPKSLGVDASAWETDPLTLDSALQLVGLWVRETKDASALPTYMGQYRQYRDFEGDITCHIEMDDIRGGRGEFTATFVDEGGLVVAIVEQGQYASRRDLNETFRK